MSVRLINTHVSLQNSINWTVEIHDRNYTGAPLEFDLRGEGFTLDYQGTDKPFNTIIPSRLVLPIVVTSTAFDTFFSDIVQADETRFAVVVKRNGTKYWVGRVVIEQFTRENKHYPYTFTITAVDGLALLKDLNYSTLSGNNEVPFSGYQTLFEVVFNCLDKIGLNDYYAATDNFLATSITWTEARHNLAGNEDALFRTRVGEGAWYKKSEKGEYEYKKCYEVLHQICQTFGARLFMAFGAYRIIQINEYSNGTIKELGYREDRTYRQNVSINRTLALNDTIRIKLGGGTFRYLQGLKSILNHYNHRGSDNLLPGIGWSYTNESTYNAGNIATDGNTDKLLIKSQIEWSSTNLSVDKPYYHKWRFTIKLGNYYLKREAVHDRYNVYYKQVSWRFNELSYYELATDYLITEQSDLSAVLDISFKTPFMPDAGVFTIKLEYVGTFDFDNTLLVGPNLTIDWNTYGDSVEFLKDGKTVEREETRTYELINDASTGNSTILELKSIIGDGVTTQSAGKLQTYDGTDYRDSTAWSTAGNSEGLAIQELVMQEIIKGRKTPIEVLENEIQSVDLHGVHAISYDGKVWVMMSAQFRSNIDRWAGAWFCLSDDTGLTTFKTPKGKYPDLPIRRIENPLEVDAGKKSGNTIISILEAVKNATIHEKIVSDTNRTTINVGGNIIGLTPGQTGRIINPTTGVSEIFTLEAVDNDGNMVIDHTFDNDYPEGSYIIKDILTPTEPNTYKVAKLLNQTGTYTDVGFDLPTVNIDQRLTVNREGAILIYAAHYKIGNDMTGKRRRIIWENSYGETIPLDDEAVIIQIK